MKKLTYNELLEAPAMIQFLYMMAEANIPVGLKMCEDAIREHPEYFLYELEHRRKWELIPQHVHDDYLRELKTLTAEVYKELPPSKGISGWVDVKEFEEWSAVYMKCRKAEIQITVSLYKKHYGDYGIEWGGVVADNGEI